MNDSHLGADILVYGGTPAGIAGAVRAAREGLSVVLVNHTHTLGGMMANGLLQWDAQSDRRRCPFFRELLQMIEAHYRDASGEGSIDHLNAQYRKNCYPVGQVEPHVVERLFRRLVAAEPKILLLEGWYVAAVRRRYNRVESVLLREMAGDRSRSIDAKVFIDAGYEGDLAALAGVPFRVGRESHDETREPHAGRLYTNVRSGHGPDPAIAARLGLTSFHMVMGGVDPASPRTGDFCVQAYNLRPVVTTDAARGVPLITPPARYSREEYLRYSRKGIALHTGDRCLNRKSTYNNAILPGENWLYPNGDWSLRQRLYERHRDFALGLMWFLQNDPSVPADQQEQHRQWRLCADEWPENNHVPYEMYVRETRRIVARHVLSEHDLSPQPQTDMPRTFSDSVAFTDWFMDSHSCDRDYTYGDPISDAFPYDGKMILGEEFRPGQIPYRSLLPIGVDNLLVPVCLGATHVAWGAVRLEPCWIHLGEVAGFAAAIALREGTLPGRMDGEGFAHTLEQRGVETTFALRSTTEHSQ